MFGYRQRIHSVLRTLLLPRVPFARALDFGSGDGWFASQFLQEGLLADVTPVDTFPRKQCYVSPMIYSGDRLPFADLSFDLTYCIDVLHHCSDPLGTLRDVLRCSKSYVAIKDHTYRSLAGRLFLCLLDEIGNRRFGVQSLYKYQQEWQWFPCFECEGFVLEELVYPAACHSKPLGWVTDDLHFIALWKRERLPQPS
jgi:hypothetical protein